MDDAGDTDNDAAIAVLATPSAAISSALARTTSRCVPDCDRANDSSTSRCPVDISNAGTGCLMPKSYRTYSQFIAGHTTSEASPLTAEARGWSGGRVAVRLWGWLRR